MMTQPASPTTFYSALPKRSLFLIILCALTGVSSVLGIFNAVVSYSSADLVAGACRDLLETVRPDLDQELPGHVLDRVSEMLVAQNFRQQATANLVYNLLTLAGAVLMWKSNKLGFYLYVAGVIVATVSPLFVFGGFLGSIISAGTSFMSLVFIVLYALNLKDMRWGSLA